MEKYKHWQLLECLPKGWKIDKTAGSPLSGYEFCTNGKSVFNGQERALVRVIRQHTPRIEYTPRVELKPKKKSYKECPFPSKDVNVLARKRMQEKLLKDIQFDLMVCKLEGWNQLEYLNELKALINSLGKQKRKISNSKPDQLKIFFLND